MTSARRRSLRAGDLRAGDLRAGGLRAGEIRTSGFRKAGCHRVGKRSRYWSFGLRLSPITAVRAVLAAIALVRLAGAARRAAPVQPPPPAIPAATDEAAGITVVIPARDEERRIRPVLDAMVGAPGIAEVIVVDDESSDQTAAVAMAAGARVVGAGERPPSWAGKTWALQQGLLASTTEWVVTLDADTDPAPVLAVAAVRRAIDDGYQLLTLAGSYDSPTPGARWLHPAMLTTLVYRFGPPGRSVKPERQLANGQCMIIDRSVVMAHGGLAPVAGEPVEDVALARHLAGAGVSVGFLDAASLLRVRGYDSLIETARGWGRSIALPGVEPMPRQLLDASVVLVAQVLPLPRLLAGRGDIIDLVLLLSRLGTLLGTARASTRGGLAYWLSPLADPLAAAILIRGIFTNSQQWRGRRYRTGR